MVPEPLDIVIPVYRGEAETRACIQSVLAARCARAVEIVVIDDASPEPAISEWLRSLAREHRVTLIAHSENRGFVASVNEGMALHPARDVVLLNSDTEVADGWADRLAAHLAADPAIGTVTPFSTNATICSYPRTLASNPMPPGESTASLDADFAAANAGRRVDIPTAVGFCMTISRRCLDAVGNFDFERYGAGYGEEVDFCMRAARAGFRNVLAGDVFVRHVGEVSFGGSGADRRADLQRLRRHPGAMRSEAMDGRVRLDWPRPGEDFVLWLEAGRDEEARIGLVDALGARAGLIPELDPRWLVPPPAPAAAAEAPRESFMDRLRRLF